MSIWDKIKGFTTPYADDDDYEDYEDDEEGTEEPEEQPVERTRTRRSGSYTAPAGDSSSSNQTTSPNGSFSGRVVNSTSGAKQEVVLFHPVNFNDTSKAADDLRNKKAVIVNMENIDKAMARRVVDFLSGVAYAIDGKVKKVAQSTYLFCPHNMDVVGDLESAPGEVDGYV